MGQRISLDLITLAPDEVADYIHRWQLKVGSNLHRHTNPSHAQLTLYRVGETDFYIRDNWGKLQAEQIAAMQLTLVVSAIKPISTVLKLVTV